MSSARQVQTDTESKKLDRMVENCFRFYSSFHQYNWDEHVPDVQFAYKYAITNDLCMLLYQVNLRYILNLLSDFASGMEVPAQFSEVASRLLKILLMIHCTNVTFRKRYGRKSTGKQSNLNIEKYASFG